MSLCFVIIGAIGAILSASKNRWCFIVWVFPNAYWIWYNWPGMQSWVFIIMMASCAAGWICWSATDARDLEIKVLKLDKKILEHRLERANKWRPRSAEPQ